MTRLVGVRAVCDGCSAAAATIFCVDHRTVLCKSCNTEQHSSSPSSEHQCVDLASSVTALPFCEHCDDAPATTYCQSEGNTLCDKCDKLVHLASPAHNRTPIESTLRNRAVEFRGGARKFTSGVKSSPHQSSKQQATHIKLNHVDVYGQPRKRSTVAIPTNSTTPPHPKKPDNSRSNNSSQRRRSAKVLAKRKSRRNSPQLHPNPQHSQSQQLQLQQALHTMQQLHHHQLQQQPLLPVPTPQTPSQHNQIPRPPDILDRCQYPNFLFPPGASATVSPYVPFGHVPTVSPPSLIDPLSGDPAVQFRSEHHRNPYVEVPTIPNFDSIVTYGTIDLSFNTAVDTLNPSSKSATAYPSAASSRLKSPEFDPPSVSQLGPIAGRAPPNTPQPNAIAAAAAAAAAAGEMYLLNSVSSGSGSSSGRVTPPLADAPDPAAVTEVAIAAAESAVASGEFNVASKQTRIAETITEAFGNQVRLTRASKNGRRTSENATEAHGRGNESQASQTQILDEEVRRLDMDTGVGMARNGRGGAVRENRLNRPRQDTVMTGRNGDLLGQITDDVLSRGGDPIGELDMPRDDFGFDAMDLGQFEQNGAIGFSLSDYRTRSLEWDEGG